MFYARQKIVPNIWFNYGQVENAVNFYVSVFTNAKVEEITPASKTGFETHGIPAGDPLNIEFEIEGHKFIGINGGPMFKPNPSISFLVTYKTNAEVNRIWDRLAASGKPVMELGKYPHSERYGWVEDKFGVSWQIMAVGDNPVRQRVVPTLMFTGPRAGTAETAANFYAGIFDSGKVGDIMRYGKGEEPDLEGTVKHLRLVLDGQEFAAMDSARPHKFNFTEGVSLMVTCGDQKEVDFYWNHLTAGGEESVCGWLKDKFGVSWQVVPEILGKMMRDSNQTRVERVTAAFLKMKKFDVAALRRAFEGETVEPGARK